MGDSELDDVKMHQLSHRELFLSRQYETINASQIRGKCLVTLYCETEMLPRYSGKEVPKQSALLNCVFTGFHWTSRQLITTFICVYYSRIGFTTVWCMIHNRRHYLLIKEKLELVQITSQWFHRYLKTVCSYVHNVIQFWILNQSL